MGRIVAGIALLCFGALVVVGALIAAALVFVTSASHGGGSLGLGLAGCAVVASAGLTAGAGGVYLLATKGATASEQADRG